MPTAKVRNLKNKEVGEVTLSDAVFGVELNESLIHTAVTNYLANKRQGTSATKTRGNVSGSGRKLWKQKGTGRARIASLRSPLWKGGGNVHGPQPRDWSSQLPKKMRRGALRSALSERLREGNLIIIDEFVIDNPKTKDFINILTTMELADKKRQTKTLIVDSLDNANLILASRNVKKTKITNGYGLNIYDLLYHEKLLISKAALEELNHLLDPNREKGETAPTVVETKAEEKPKAKKEAKAKKEETKAEEPVVDKAPVAETEEAPAAEEPNTGEVATEATSETVSEETTTGETSATENTDEEEAQ
ncbi:MAG: 50S ribosomal protein L4 [Pyrinomonadaceae bacterium]